MHAAGPYLALQVHDPCCSNFSSMDRLLGNSATTDLLPNEMGVETNLIVEPRTAGAWKIAE